MHEPVNGFRELIEVRRIAEGLIGEQAWSLLSSYGKFMDGPYSGSYVGGVPVAAQRALVDRLARGETVPVHLVHRHRSGCYESSSLRWSQGALVMVYLDREVPA
jgi:hypothetical protein